MAYMEFTLLEQRWIVVPKMLSTMSLKYLVGQHLKNLNFYFGQLHPKFCQPCLCSFLSNNTQKFELSIQNSYIQNFLHHVYSFLSNSTQKFEFIFWILTSKILSTMFLQFLVVQYPKNLNFYFGQLHPKFFRFLSDSIQKIEFLFWIFTSKILSTMSLQFLVVQHPKI